MILADLIRDPGTGQLSVTKIWTNVAYAAGTAAFLRAAFAECPSPDADIWLIYLGVVGSHCAVSKLISMRYGGGYGGAGYGGAGYGAGYSYRPAGPRGNRDDAEGQ